MMPLMGAILTSFLSTLSLRRATTSWLARLASRVNFYPRSPCGERLVILRKTNTPLTISIHALLAESDLSMAALRQALSSISIHALLAESDILTRYQL